MSTMWTFDGIESKHDGCRDKDEMWHEKVL